MRHVIVDDKGNLYIQHNNYKDQDKESTDYLNNKYHNQSTGIKNLPETEEEWKIFLAEQRETSVLIHNKQTNGKSRNTSIRKLVI